MNRPDIEATILNVLNTVLRLNLPAGNNICRDEISQWDSLKHIEIIFAIEEELKLEFSQEEMATLNSIAKIADLVQAKYAS